MGCRHAALGALLVASSGWGCASSPRAWTHAQPQFRPQATEYPASERSASERLPGERSAPARRPGRARGRPPAAVAAQSPSTPIERVLHDRGLRFGTDGSLGALYGYLRDNHEAVNVADARPGDIVFFDLGADGGGGGACGGHGGVVEAVDPDGRITFREVRDGRSRRSYASPTQPAARRGMDGRVLNTFLRPRRPGDPPYFRYFAGDMLCGVFRAHSS